MVGGEETRTPVGRDCALCHASPTKLPSPTPKFHPQSHFFLFVLKNNGHDIKNTNAIGRGTAENVWVPPERQHQGLRGPPASPALEQLGVQTTTGSCLGLRPSSRQEEGERAVPPQ